MYRRTDGRSCYFSLLRLTLGDNYIETSVSFGKGILPLTNLPIGILNCVFHVSKFMSQFSQILGNSTKLNDRNNYVYGNISAKMKNPANSSRYFQTIFIFSSRLFPKNHAIFLDWFQAFPGCGIRFYFFLIVTFLFI